MKSRSFFVGGEKIRYVVHPSFNSRSASAQWGGGHEPEANDREFAVGHMPDEMTRALAQRMHFAAFRADGARLEVERDTWLGRYHRLRDRIILGNRKLVFSAVRKKLYQAQAADDLIGDCYLVMIRAVAAYNPWMGIRFSTYAFTCLMRALTRLNQRSAADKLSQHLALDTILDEEPSHNAFNDMLSGAQSQIDELLSDDHELLTAREKTVLRRRFRLGAGQADSTLEKVGKSLGISKERVRQVQATALEKLRHALAEPASV